MDTVLSRQEIAHEFWGAPGQGQTKHVVKYQHLAVGTGARADADYRDPYGLTELLG
ncbi:hypothetical protein D3C72_2121470 [compost metagenome]